MNKKCIIKWSKRIGIAIISIASIGLIIISGKFAYEWIHDDFYIPSKCESLYNQGLQNPSKSDSIALLLDNLGDSKKAVSLLEKNAFKGRVPSQVLLGKLYTHYNPDKSAFWYLKAAQNGNTEAQGKIGHYYLQGEGVIKDYTKALYWIKKSADGGNADAQYELGNLYSKGIALYDINIIEKNYVYLGDNEFRKDGGMDIIEVTTEELRYLLSNPHDIYLRIDINKAKYYWRLAANQGIQEAKDALEKIYE